MWETIEGFKQKTNISVLSNEDIEYYLKIAKELVRKYLFVKKVEGYTTDNTNSIKLNMYGMFLGDYLSYDGVVDEDDIYVYELNKTTYVETNLSGAISGFQPKYGFLTMLSGYPTASDKNLYVEYYLTRYQWTECYETIKMLQRLYAIREMIMEKPMAAQAVMSGQVTLNGMTFDSGALNLENINNTINLQINRIIQELQPLMISSRDVLYYDNPYQFVRF